MSEIVRRNKLPNIEHEPQPLPGRAKPSGDRAFGGERPPARADVRAQAAPARPRTAPAQLSRRAAAPDKHEAKTKAHGRINLYENEHAFLGPKVLRDLAKPIRGFPFKGPDEFVVKGEGKSLKDRVAQKEQLKRHPVDRDPTFVAGDGGLRWSLDAVPAPNTLFHRMYDNGTIDFVAVNVGGIRNSVRWAQPVGRGRMVWTDAPSEVAVGRWLPIFIDGIREHKDPYRFLAIRGSEDLIEEAGQQLTELAAELLPPFKTALDTREPTTVAVALHLMNRILELAPPVATVWIKALPHWSSVFSLFRSHSRMSVDMGYNRRMVSNVKQLVFQVVEKLEIYGGPGATELVRRYAPGFDPAVTDAVVERAAQQLPADKLWDGKPYTLI